MAYNEAIYLYYGKQETNEEKILREIKELKDENHELHNQLETLLEKYKGDEDKKSSEEEKSCEDDKKSNE